MCAETVTTVPKQHLSNLHCSHIISWLTSIGVKIYLVSNVQGALASGSRGIILNGPILEALSRVKFHRN